MMKLSNCVSISFTYPDAIIGQCNTLLLPYIMTDVDVLRNLALLTPAGLSYAHDLCLTCFQSNPHHWDQRTHRHLSSSKFCDSVELESLQSSSFASDNFGTYGPWNTRDS